MSEKTAIVYSQAERPGAARVDQVRRTVARIAAKIVPEYVSLEVPKEPGSVKLPPPYRFSPEFSCHIETPLKRDQGNVEEYAGFVSVSDQRHNYRKQLQEQGVSKDIRDRHEWIVAEAGSNLARYGDGGTFVALRTPEKAEQSGTVLLFINASRTRTNHGVPQEDHEHGRGGDILGEFADDHGVCYANKETWPAPTSDTDPERIALRTYPTASSTEARWYFIADMPADEGFGGFAIDSIPPI